MVCFMGSLPERGELIPNLGDAPNLNWFYLIVHFFCSSKRNEPKKRAPEMPTSAKTGACDTGQNGAIVLSAVRTISGLPSRRQVKNLLQNFNLFPKKIWWRCSPDGVLGWII